MLLWSRAISNDVQVNCISPLDQEGIRLAIEAACLAKCKARDAVKISQKARQVVDFMPAA